MNSGTAKLGPDTIFIIGGGVGDALQCLPFMLANRDKGLRYFVSTHMSSLSDLFKAVDIPIERLEVFTNSAEGNDVMIRFAKAGQLYQCPRTHYFRFNPFSIPQRLFERQGRTIGVHLGASQFSIDLIKYQGLPTKELPVKLVHELATDDLDVLLFGTKGELDHLNLKEQANLRFVCCPDIADSLGYVCHCEAIIASDSAIKTMSSMLGIPTIVWMGGHGDQERDKNFILPYLNAGIMALFRYGTLRDEEFNQGMEFTRKALSAVL